MLPSIGESGAPLASFLPEVPIDAPERELRCRLAAAVTFLAGLELTRDESIGLHQETAWAAIQIGRGQEVTEYEAA